MNCKGVYLRRRFVAALVCSLFILQLVSGLFGMGDAIAADVRSLDVWARLKDEVALEDVEGMVSVRKANVLFLIEATDVMSFSPKGVPPRVVRIKTWFDSYREGIHYDKTYAVYGYGIDGVNSRMAQATFGMGALPPAYYDRDLYSARNLYGRDIDHRNNYVKLSNDPLEDVALNSNNYYAPFKGDKNPLSAAYKKQTTPLQTSFNPASLVYGEGDLTIGDSLLGKERTSYIYNRLPAQRAFPYALIFKNPAYWEKGYPGLSVGSTAPDMGELVPNDSRMYQTKLVLWRLLEESNIFQNLRIGLATTFLSPANINATPEIHAGLDNRTDQNGIFRVSPWGNTVHTQRFFYVDNGQPVPGDTDKYEPGRSFYRSTGTSAPLSDMRIDNKRVELKRFSNGILSSTTTGNSRRWNGLHTQIYPIWHNSDVGAIYNPDNTGDEFDDDTGTWSGGDRGKDKQRKLWRVLNRASLHVPIRGYDEVWTKGPALKMTQADKIRMWIDGFADLHSGGGVNYYEDITRDTQAAARKNQFHFYNNPEIGIAGKDTLPMSIYPDPLPKYKMSRDWYNKNNWIWYSSATDNVNYRARYILEGTEFQRAGIPKAFFNAGSGEAAGSVLDFFSPHPQLSIVKETASDNHIQSISHNVNRANLADVSFPIRSSCEDNWVIVVASGIEPKTDTPGQRVYHAWDAIKNLYEHTKNNTVTMLLRDVNGNPLDRNNKVIPENSPNRVLKEIKLDNPIRTLVIGIVARPEDAGGDKLLHDEIVEMRKNLTRMARAGQGDDPNDENSPYVPFFADDVQSLRIAISDAIQFIETHQKQPSKGAIMESPSLGDMGANEAFNYYTSAYRIRRDNQWEGYLARFSASEDKGGRLTVTKQWELADIVTGKRTSRDLRYWKEGAFVKLTNDDLRALSGLNANKMDTSNMPSGDSFKNYSPEEALFEWLNGYDHSYADDGRDYERLSVLAEVGQGGVAFVDDPTSGDPLPGYAEWASKSVPQDPVIYMQTNDGILHAVNPVTGDEQLAIVPPPVLVPSRMAALKTRRLSNGYLQWIDVKGPESAKSHDITAPRSRPLFLLDGALQKRRFSDSDGSNWRTYLLADLGRGGSGLYMLDVDDHDNPKLMWYRERVEKSLLEMSPSDNVPTVAQSPDPHFMKLGFNPPRAAMGVTGEPNNMRNIIVMAGGAQNNVDMTRNGDEGAVLLILDPKTGNLIKGFDTGEVLSGIGENDSPGVTAPNMGMMVSEPTLTRSVNNKYITGQIYAADNRGNIFNVALEEDSGSGALKPLPVQSWKLRTVATLQEGLSAAASSNFSFSIPHGIATYMSGRDIWLAGGTADVRVRTDGDAQKDGVLRNSAQMVFSFNTQIGQSAVFTRNDLKELRPKTASDALMPADDKRGWYFKLVGDELANSIEYTAAKPVIVNGILFVGTFIPQKINWSSQEICAAGTRMYGDSRLYAVNVRTGGQYWPGGKYAVLSGAKITGLALSRMGKKQRLVVTYDKLSDKDVSFSAPDATHMEDLNSFVLDAPPGGGVGNLRDNQNVIQYWLLK
ncbi:MAG: hypothetical protein LBQ58_10165 [Synergistaceae bacterium]|nr:hypothetical protein [Synergistaceae bacterium]